MCGRSLVQEGPDGFEALNVLSQDLEGSKEGDCQEGAGDAPEQPPEKHTDEHPHRIELEALPIDDGTHQVVLQCRDDQIRPGSQENAAYRIKLAEGSHAEENNHAGGTEIRNKLEYHGQSSPQPRIGHPQSP